MSDLSRLLDDVYGPSGSAGPQAPPAPAAGTTGLPDWALDSVLDDAFSDWAPTEGGGTSDPTGPGSIAGTDPDAVATVPVARAWCRDDDDILPTRRGRGGKLVREELVLVAAGSDPAHEVDEVDLDQPVAPKRRFGLRRG